MTPRKALIFAAGLGTRLKPLTDTMPKALVPVGGRPLLSHVIGRLSAAGYGDLVVNVHHFAGMIRDYIDGASFPDGVRVRISDESDLLRETGGGILHARSMLEDSESFLIHNVDILSNLELSSVRLAEGALATLVVSPRETSRYLLFDENGRLVGWTNVKTGEVRSPFGEINPDSFRRLAFSGIHIMSSRVLPLLEEYSRKIGSERFPIMDFYLDIASKETITGLEVPDLKIVDVGKLDTLAAAESFISAL